MPTPPPDLIARLRGAEPRELARLLTTVAEPEAAPDPGREALLRAIYPATGHARRVGLTGSPGAGKSTLADALAVRFRAAGDTVGIVAVDPSSPFTGGAILGDRVRMQRHHADPGIFIRSLASRGVLGGLSDATDAVVAVLDAAGKDQILVETVGVGQGEVDVAHLVDVTVVVLVPGMGDGVQSLKAGLLEIADILVINKADRGPERLEQELRGLLALAPRAPGDWCPPVLDTVATSGQGIDQLAAAIAARFAWIEAHGGLQAHRAGRWRRRLPELVRRRLAARVLDPYVSPQGLAVAANAIAAGTDPYAAIDAVIDAALSLKQPL